MSLTATQIRTIQAIVNLFETGHVLGDYGQVTVMAGDTGHLTFGRSQTTLGSGNLHRLLEQYCSNGGARFGRRLAVVLPRTAARDAVLDRDMKLHNVLRASADDPVMRDTQDEFFDEMYFRPAMKTADRNEIGEPLGRTVVYDSFVHGSWRRIRDRVEGTPQSRGERVWVKEYVVARRSWLAAHPRADLRATVYRMDALGRLIELGAWGLELPVVVRAAESRRKRSPGCHREHSTAHNRARASSRSGHRRRSSAVWTFDSCSLPCPSEARTSAPMASSVACRQTASPNTSNPKACRSPA